jgi:hypothetical protein
MTDTLEPVLLDTGTVFPEVGDIPPVLAAAVVAAWAELGNLKREKTANAGTYSYAYSDLGDLLDMVRPILAKHDLALLQPVTREAGETYITIETWLLHASGLFLRWRFCVAATGSPQQIGSGITYGRRYSGQAAVGVASEDDDGQAAAKAVTVTPPRQTRPKASSASDEATRQTRHAMALFDDLGLADRDNRLAVTSTILGREVGSWADTSPLERSRVIAELLVRRDQEQAADDLAERWDADHAEG